MYTQSVNSLGVGTPQSRYFFYTKYSVEVARGGYPLAEKNAKQYFKAYQYNTVQKIF